MCPIQYFDRWALPRLLLDNDTKDNDTKALEQKIINDLLDPTVWISEQFVKDINEDSLVQNEHFEAFINSTLDSDSGKVALKSDKNSSRVIFLQGVKMTGS